MEGLLRQMPIHFKLIPENAVEHMYCYTCRFGGWVAFDFGKELRPQTIDQFYNARW